MTHNFDNILFEVSKKKIFQRIPKAWPLNCEWCQLSSGVNNVRKKLKEKNIYIYKENYVYPYLKGSNIFLFLKINYWHSLINQLVYYQRLSLQNMLIINHEICISKHQWFEHWH